MTDPCMTDPRRHVPISGPAVDALDARKERGRPDPVPEAEMRAGWERCGQAVLAGLKALVAA